MVSVERMSNGYICRTWRAMIVKARVLGSGDEMGEGDGPTETTGK